MGGGVYWSRGMGYREGIIGYVYIRREEAGRRNLRGGDMTLREYIYIREEVCILVRVYRREEYVLAKGV